MSTSFSRTPATSNFLKVYPSVSARRVRTRYWNCNTSSKIRRLISARGVLLAIQPLPTSTTSPSSLRSRLMRRPTRTSPPSRAIELRYSLDNLTSSPPWPKTDLANCIPLSRPCLLPHRSRTRRRRLMQ
jgi:hypothetical protein